MSFQVSTHNVLPLVHCAARTLEIAALSVGMSGAGIASNISLRTTIADAMMPGNTPIIKSNITERKELTLSD